MKILSVGKTNNSKPITFREVFEGGLSWREQKIALEHRMINLREHVAEIEWWQKASEWDKVVKTFKDFLKNIFRK